MLFPESEGMVKPVRGFLVKQDARSEHFQKVKGKLAWRERPPASLASSLPQTRLSKLLEVPVAEEKQYWASLSKNGKLRTLHYTGACPTVRGVDVKEWQWTTLEAGNCAQACKGCFGEKGLGCMPRPSRKRQDDAEIPFEGFEEPRVEDIEAVLSSSESSSSEEPALPSSSGSTLANQGTGVAT